MYIGSQIFAASHLSSCCNIFFLIDNTRNTAITHHIRGETIQLEAIIQICSQSTTLNHTAVIQAQTNHHTIECVVETGALKNVAIFTHIAAQANVEIIIAIN
jgi:hypothetical protein